MGMGMGTGMGMGMATGMGMVRARANDRRGCLAATYLIERKGKRKDEQRGVMT